MGPFGPVSVRKGRDTKQLGSKTSRTARHHLENGLPKGEPGRTRPLCFVPMVCHQGGDTGFAQIRGRSTVPVRKPERSSPLTRLGMTVHSLAGGDPWASGRRGKAAWVGVCPTGTFPCCEMRIPHLGVNYSMSPPI